MDDFPDKVYAGCFLLLSLYRIFSWTKMKLISMINSFHLYAHSKSQQHIVPLLWKRKEKKRTKEYKIGNWKPCHDLSYMGIKDISWLGDVFAYRIEKLEKWWIKKFFIFFLSFSLPSFLSTTTFILCLVFKLLILNLISCDSETLSICPCLTYFFSDTSQCYSQGIFRVRLYIAV